jgi:flagellar basal body-associated protein FliL
MAITVIIIGSIIVVLFLGSAAYVAYLTAQDATTTEFVP